MPRSAQPLMGMAVMPGNSSRRGPPRIELINDTPPCCRGPAVTSPLRGPTALARLLPG